MVTLTFLLIQLQLGYFEKHSPLFDHVTLLPSNLLVLVPVSGGTESFGGYDTRTGASHAQLVGHWGTYPSQSVWVEILVFPHTHIPVEKYSGSG